ncbi:MAG: YicC/YloC family endoribonuclease [Pseudomonadota bacterium]
MTAYATRTGAHGPFTWVWELRGVNGKGLDLRLRVPDWIAGLDQAVRSALSAALARGNLQVSLKVTRAEAAAGAVNDAAVIEVVTGLKQVEALAGEAGLHLAPLTAADIYSIRAVTEGGGDDDGGAEFASALKGDIGPLVADFIAMRDAEGAALGQVIDEQLSGIAGHVAAARALLPDRAAAQEATFRAAMARVLKDIDIDEARLAQELAQLAIKADVMEEIDRLEAHITAARDLLGQEGPVGRKLDFLMQEFNREANTLCAKSGDAALTAIGLDLKVAIDQMREQIQNVE